MLYFTPHFMHKKSVNQPNQVNDPWYIPVVLTGKPALVLLIAQLERSGIITDT